MKILVTGANGFLGRKVVEAFLEKGHTVRALVRPSAALKPFNTKNQPEVFLADLRVAKNLEEAFCDIDVLVHLAAQVTGTEEAQLASTVVGTERLLTAMSKTPVKRILLASSFSVYDWSRIPARLSEESPVETDRLYDRDPYAIAKTLQERAVVQISRENNWKLTILRPGFIWGKGSEYFGGLGQRLGPCEIVIGPFREVPITHVENCAEAFVLLAENSSSEGQTFNVVDGQRISASRYLEDHLFRMAKKVTVIWVPYWLAYFLVCLVYKISKVVFKGKGKLPGILIPRRFEARFKPLQFPNEKLKKTVSWKPVLSYQEALSRTYADA